MKQEDYNEMMRYPWERTTKKAMELPICPACKNRYCGDGTSLCADCAKATIEEPTP